MLCSFLLVPPILDHVCLPKQDSVCDWIPRIKRQQLECLGLGFLKDDTLIATRNHQYSTVLDMIRTIFLYLENTFRNMVVFAMIHIV